MLSSVAAVESPGASRWTAGARPLVRLLGFSAAAWFAAQIGLATWSPEASFSMIWPIPGVALLWLASSRSRRQFLVDCVTLTLVTGVRVYLDLDSVSLALVGMAQTLAQPLVTLFVIRRLAPRLWGGGATAAPLGRVRDVAVFLAACVAGAVVAAAVRGTGLGLEPLDSWLAVLLILVRNLSWVLAIGAVGFVVMPYLVAGDVVGRLVRAWRSISPAGRALHAAEFTAMLGATGLSLVVAFFLEAPLPVDFTLMLVAVWAGTRFPPVLALLQPLTAGTIAILATLSQEGIMVSTSDAVTAALLAQALFTALMMATLTLSVGTGERRAATARAEASDAAARTRASLLDAIIANLREGVVVVRADGAEMVRNPAGRSILDLPPGQPYDEAMPAPSYGIFDDSGKRFEVADLPHARALAGVDTAARDYLVKTPANPDGLVLEIMATHLAPSEPTGDPVAVVNFRDVTAEREDRDELASFAGIVAHDLKNPLAIISGWTEVLADELAEGPVDAEQGSAIVTRIQAAASHMDVFISDLLSYTLARDHPLTVERVDLSAVAEDLAGLRRDADVPPGITIEKDLWVEADLALVRRLMDNLIGNAVKYVAAGVRPDIAVTGTRVGDRLEVRVSDNGIGVPLHHRERIFETFQRAHGAEFRGTGIGLSICHTVVRRHGGEIRVEDNPTGRGSVFVFTLPAADAVAA